MDPDRKRELLLRRSALASQRIDLPAPAPWHAEPRIKRIPPPTKPAKP